MGSIARHAGLLLILMSAVFRAAAAPADDDPFLWLEDSKSQAVRDQVQRWNERTLAQLTRWPAFDEYRGKAEAVLTADEQLSAPETVLGPNVTVLLRNARHPAGLWRTATLASYMSGSPAWTTLLDLDRLNAEEGRKWVWQGADCIEPDYRRCLLHLSPGGTDARAVREFDTTTRQFVAEGFNVPAAKTNVSWLDQDHLVVSTDIGPGSLTSSGYGRDARVWRRGTPLNAARSVLRGEDTDVSVTSFAFVTPTGREVLLSRAKTLWQSDVYRLRSDGAAERLAVPETGSVQALIGDELIVRLNQADGPYPAGAVLSYSLRQRGAPPALLFAPKSNQSIAQIASTRSILWINLLEDVSGRLLALEKRKGRWTSRLAPLPPNSTVKLVRAAREPDLVFATVEGMLIPPSLFAVDSLGAQKIEALPDRFDPSKYIVERRRARSSDGTIVPYFVARPKAPAGPLPVLLHAYGSFRVAQTPAYLAMQPARSAPLAALWLEKGNIFVIANVRGGGEYGPQWHASAVGANKQRSIDDLNAVAEDLIESKIAARGKIALHGRSAGGLLVAAALVQQPKLYGAAIAGAPLLDMKRYSKLLAGASWTAEYGDPDRPADWAFLSRYSPYHQLAAGTAYPPLLFYLSTSDDRVHPGHARKMAARLEALGQTFSYLEQEEGGHASAVPPAQEAYRATLLLAFLSQSMKLD